VDHHSDIPRALFLSRDSQLVHDERVCSGDLPSRLEGKACPWADRGRFPAGSGRPQSLMSASEASKASDAVLPARLDKPMGRLGDWLDLASGESGVAVLQVFRCRQMFLLVVPGVFAKGRKARRNPDGGA
jgi:hypothetical protein